VLVSPDGKRIVTGGTDSTVRVWDASRYEPLLTLQADSSVTALAMSLDGQEVAAGTHIGTVHVWNAGADR
jgi:WD40 repeat protein